MSEAILVKGGFIETPYVHPTGDGNSHVPANGTTNTGKVLTAGADAGTYTWGSLDNLAVKETPIVLVEADKTLALTDRASLQKCLSSSAIVITIPLDSTVAFPVGTEIIIVRYGAGAVSVAAVTNVTLYSSGSKKVITAQYDSVTIKKMAADEWLLIGALSA